jgi:hypothetical protein
MRMSLAITAGCMEAVRTVLRPELVVDQDHPGDNFFMILDMKRRQGPMDDQGRDVPTVCAEVVVQYDELAIYAQQLEDWPTPTLKWPLEDPQLIDRLLEWAKTL